MEQGWTEEKRNAIIPFWKEEMPVNGWQDDLLKEMSEADKEV